MPADPAIPATRRRLPHPAGRRPRPQPPRSQPLSPPPPRSQPPYRPPPAARRRTGTGPAGTPQPSVRAMDDPDGHQARSPTRVVMAGTRIERTTNVSMRTPIATATPTWNRTVRGAVAMEPKVPARMRPAEVMTAARVPRRDPDPVPDRPMLALLANPAHQEDVVVGAQRHQQHEHHQRQVEGDARLAQDLLEDERREPDGRGVRDQDGADEIERRHDRPEQQDQHDEDPDDGDHADALEVVGERVLDVGELGCRPADVGRGCRARSRARPRGHGLRRADDRERAAGVRVVEAGHVERVEASGRRTRTRPPRP